MCDIIRQETSDGKRVICETEHHIALAPYASYLPFQMLILPKMHRPFFERVEKSEVMDSLNAFQEGVPESIRGPWRSSVQPVCFIRLRLRQPGTSDTTTGTSK